MCEHVMRAGRHVLVNAVDLVATFWVPHVGDVCGAVAEQHRVRDVKTAGLPLPPKTPPHC